MVNFIFVCAVHTPLQASYIVSFVSFPGNHDRDIWPVRCAYFFSQAIG